MIIFGKYFAIASTIITNYLIKRCQEIISSGNLFYDKQINLMATVCFIL